MVNKFTAHSRVVVKKESNLTKSPNMSLQENMVSLRLINTEPDKDKLWVLIKQT